MTLATINHTISVLNNMLNDNWDLWETTTQAKRKNFDLMMDYKGNDDMVILLDLARTENARLEIAILSLNASRKKLIKELESMNNFQSAALVSFQKENQDLRNLKASL